MTINRKHCPFCDSPASHFYGELNNRFLCGTVGPDTSNEYVTGTECDKTVFRNGYLRCIGILHQISDNCTESEFGDRFTIPADVMRRVFDETNRE